MEFVPENQVRTRLPGGGRRIRTAGPSRETSRSFRRNGKCRRGEKGSLEIVVYPARDRGFESPSLQRGDNCEPVRSGGIQPGDPLRGSTCPAISLRSHRSFGNGAGVTAVRWAASLPPSAMPII